MDRAGGANLVPMLVRQAPLHPPGGSPRPRRALRLIEFVAAGLASTLLACAPEGVVGVTTELPADVALYETFELVVQGHRTRDNPFTRFVEAVFELDDREIRVDGFYDGDLTWRVRFAPELPGEWHYTWRLGDQRGSGVVRVGSEPWTTRGAGPDGGTLRHRGHVHAQGDGRGVLVHADGSPHYWAGAKWLSAKNYGPPERAGVVNEREEDGSRHDAYYSDATFYEFLDLAVDYGLNGMLLKLGLYPLADDGVSWDLEWVRRADRWLAAMNERGVYCQITLFEPWSRRRGAPFEYSLDSSAHVLDAWSPGQRAEKENYIRYAVARFGGYSNVYWELANRIRHPGFDERTFLDEASAHYTRWLGERDPYGVAVAASDVDQARSIPEVTVEVPRTNTHLPAPPDVQRARVVNELVHDCGPVGTGARAYLDATIRTPTYRSCYRSANWLAFVSGAYGSAAASWLDLSRPLNGAARAVLQDLGRMKRLIESLPVGHHYLAPDGRHLVMGQGHLGTRSRSGHLYVSYFRGPVPAGEVTVELTEGRYLAQWIDPTSGEVLSETRHLLRRTGERAFVSLESPRIDEDAVLVIHNEAAIVVR